MSNYTAASQVCLIAGLKARCRVFVFSIHKSALVGGARPFAWKCRLYSGNTGDKCQLTLSDRSRRLDIHENQACVVFFLLFSKVKLSSDLNDLID